MTMKILNGYVCFYKGKRLEVCAETIHQAQDKAVAEFQKAHPRARVKSWDVAIMLAEKGSQQVVHDPAILPGA
jgi:hypothetical protein